MPTLNHGAVWVKKITPAKMQAFDVYKPVLGRWVKIETVFWLKGTSPSDVRDALINHDGFPANIWVKQGEK